VSDPRAGTAQVTTVVAGGGRPVASPERDLTELYAARERLRVAIYGYDAAGTERAAADAVAAWCVARAASRGAARGAHAGPLLEALRFWLVEFLFEKAKAKIASRSLHEVLDELRDRIDDVSGEA
jgi:hypothetical protein